jgi:DNA-binding GntR family transcriptional regulator
LKRYKLDRSFPVRQQAADLVQDAIMRGLLRPGEKLHQRVLASQFKLSHSAVREVLIELENRGLILKEGSSYMIARYSEDEFSDLAMMRCLLEPVACRLAAQHWNSLFGEELEQCLERMRKAFDDRDALLSWECDRDFHKIIRRHQPNRVLEAHLEKICTKLFAFYISQFIVTKHLRKAPPERIFAEHRLILETLRSRDGDRAERIVRRILERSSRRSFHIWRQARAAEEVSAGETNTDPRPLSQSEGAPLFPEAPAADPMVYTELP